MTLFVWAPVPQTHVQVCLLETLCIEGVMSLQDGTANQHFHRNWEGHANVS